MILNVKCVIAPGGMPPVAQLLTLRQWAHWAPAAQLSKSAALCWASCLFCQAKDIDRKG